MDEASVVVTVLAGALVVTNIAWAIGSSLAVRRIQKLMEKCINHGFAHSVDNREVMRIEGENDRAEVLLRELRARDRKNNPRPPSPEAQPDIMTGLDDVPTLN